MLGKNRDWREDRQRDEGSKQGFHDKKRRRIVAKGQGISIYTPAPYNNVKPFHVPNFFSSRDTRRSQRSP